MSGCHAHERPAPIEAVYIPAHDCAAKPGNRIESSLQHRGNERSLAITCSDQSWRPLRRGGSSAPVAAQTSHRASPAGCAVLGLECPSWICTRRATRSRGVDNHRHGAGLAHVSFARCETSVRAFSQSALSVSEEFGSQLWAGAGEVDRNRRCCATTPREYVKDYSAPHAERQATTGQ